MENKYKNLTIIKEIAKGFKCLEQEYKGYLIKHKFICPKGHTFKCRFDAFILGTRCPICQIQKRKNHISKVKNKFEKFGWICLFNKYIGAKKKLKVMCPNGHLQYISFDAFKGQCKYCNSIKYRNNKLNFVIKELQKDQYEYISGNYTDTYSKLTIKCPNGHKYTTRWDIFQQGSRCPICRYIIHSDRMSKEKNPAWKGGVSFEPYCEIFSDKEFREFIKQRDGNKCLNPDCTKKSKMLSIHHIDYDKKSCDQKNLITICISCNSRANIDREWHISWYRAIMYQRYGFIY
jgi:hypothetical protein